MTADVIVIGAGPAGIAAATRAAESGRRTMLVDESPRVGGQIWRHKSTSALPANARRWIARLAQSGVTIVAGASVVDVNTDAESHVVKMERRNQPLVARAESIVLATGARERFLPFPGWTLPGVIGVGAGQALLKSGVSFKGKRIVISGSGPLMMPVAAALAGDGAKLLLVAEQAPSAAVMRFAAGLAMQPGTLMQAARYRAAFVRTPYRLGTWVTAARGDGKVEEVDVTDGRTSRTIACDVLCAAFGLLPNTELARLLGCAIEQGAHVVDEHQQTTRPGVYSAGESTGVGGVDLALVEGEIAGLCAAGRSADARALFARRAGFRYTAAAMNRAFAPRPELSSLATSDTIVCRCEDVMLGAIQREWSPRQAKLYTRAGMGPCQGRICGAALELLYGWPADSVRLPASSSLFTTLIAEPAAAGSPLDQGA
jgi:NADPH-dependent 2,4-dienoyl-CoA reductase/sulfur reductase-like enzyme